MAKILIAEDDKFISKIMKYRLEKEGFSVETADDGAQALDKIKSNKYAVILLDLIMPVKDGFEVLKELKKQKNKTPVLVFSNLSQGEDKKEVLDLGAKEYYVKSDIAIDELAKAVQLYIKE